MSRIIRTIRRHFGSIPYKSAPPETPLAHYRAEKHATSSINHRLFYVNLFFLVWLADSINATVDW